MLVRIRLVCKRALYGQFVEVAHSTNADIPYPESGHVATPAFKGMGRSPSDWQCA